MTWISVKDQLPPDAGDVFPALRLVWPRGASADSVVAIYMPERARWETYGGHPLNQTVTHWMPLPEGPKSTESASKIERLERVIAELSSKQSRLQDQVFGGNATEDAKAELKNINADLSRLRFQVAELELSNG